MKRDEEEYNDVSFSSLLRALHAFVVGLFLCVLCAFAVLPGSVEEKPDATERGACRV